jgi:DNA-binding CsgD family transcriptional regulator
VSGPPLVGRELDLAVALEQLKRVELGTSASLLVRGEAGIGKTRLVDEVTARATQTNHAVLAGRADDLDHGIPYALFRDLASRATTDAIDDFRNALESASFPDVFASAVRLLRSTAATGPVVLVLEDLHVADRESLALVAPLVRLADVSMLVVATVRPGDAAADAQRLFEHFAVEGRGAVIDLDPLDRHETQALVASLLGATPDEHVANAVFDASHGNPFFTCEAAQALADAGAAVIDGGRARLVAGTPIVGLRPSTALLRRLFSGTTADVDVAKVMAVFGRFQLRHLPLVERLTGQTADEVARSFDRLVKAGLLAETAGGYGFTHSIVRDTLYEDIGPAERRRVHAAIATEMASERRAGIVLDVLELATHVAESAEVGDEDAATILIDAGRAVAATAPLVSAEYQRRAAALLPAGSPTRAAALAMQARALHLGSRPTESSDVGLAALAAMPSDQPRSSTAAIVANDLYISGRLDDAIAVVDDELARGGDRCPLEAMRVFLLFESSRPDAAAAHLDDALRSLDGPPAATTRALAYLGQYANHAARADTAAALLERLERVPEGASPVVQVAVHELLAYNDWRPGIIERTRRHIDAVRTMRPDSSWLSIAGVVETSLLRVRWMAGEWDDALHDARTAALDLEQRGNLIGSQFLLGGACEISIERGALDDAAAMAGALVTTTGSLQRDTSYVRARLARALGDTATAEQLLAHERERARQGHTNWRLAEVLVDLVELFVEQGRIDEAREVLGDLNTLAAKMSWAEPPTLALRAATVIDSNPDVARAYLDTATAEGWEVERAHARLLLGELDVDPATNLTEAYRMFDAFGAAPRRRRAAAGLRVRGLTVPRRVTQATSDLTEIEVQLARLVCEGLSNRQIATALHYSTKTIEVYLSRLYAKTGCGSRLALIRAVDSGAIAT